MGLVAIHAVDAIVSDEARLVPAFGLVEMAAHAKLGLRIEQQIFAICRVRVVTAHTGSFAIQIVFEGHGLERLHTAMALQTQDLMPARDGKRTARIEVAVALLTVAGGKGLVLVIP